ncbi:hypothetical protein BJV74DRAFT_824356, partial [Russula compacta]
QAGHSCPSSSSRRTSIARREPRVACECAEGQLKRAHRDFDTEMRHSRRACEAHESSMQTAQTELARMQSILGQHEADISTLQAALALRRRQLRHRVNM